MFYGTHVNAGAQVAGTWTLHNLLHTIEDANGAATHAGASANVHSIVGAFGSDPAVATTTFRQGDSGYAGATDTWIEPANPNTNHGNDVKLTSDGSPQSQELIKFDNIFGNGPGQVPLNATIHSAKLSIVTGTAANDETLTNVALHQLLVPFSGGSTWNSLLGGITVGSEAAATPQFTLLPNVEGDYAIVDVTSSILAFAAGQTNYGWLINPLGTDGWRPFSSNDVLNKGPILSITYSVPEPGSLSLAAVALVSLAATARRRRR